MDGLQPKRSRHASLTFGSKDDLEKCLAGYAAAAVAAGVSLAATATPAHAKIVYTPANIEIPRGRVGVPLDLNHDGVIDFSFHDFSISSGSLLAVTPQRSNNVWGRGGSVGLSPRRFASALRVGYSVRPNKTYFAKGLAYMAGGGGTPCGCTGTLGQFLGTKHRYVGLRFGIQGKMHFGWARVDVPYGRPIILRGYAYQTIPNKSIIAGKTKGPDVITLKPGSLGALAAGRR
jgi:hypothetical protein